MESPDAPPTNLLERLATGHFEGMLGPQLMLTGGALAAVAAYGPWVTLTDAVHRHAVNGTDPGRHGRETLVLALLSMVLALPALTRRGPRALALLGVPTGVAMVIYGLADSGTTNRHLHAYTEWGLWLTVAGGAGIAVGAVLAMLRR